MNKSIRISLLVVSMGVPVSPSHGEGQTVPLTLAEAREAARAGSLDVLSARARAQAANERRVAGSSFLWPQVSLEAGAVRSDDPVAAFGGRLRHGAFTAEDFDPTRLNDPGALTDWSGAVGVVWAPFDGSAVAGRAATSHQADAASLGAEWASRAAVFRAEALYLVAVGAVHHEQSAESALQAAESTLRRVELRAAEGFLTESDVLQARASAQAARARFIDAQRAVADARGRLSVALGWEAGAIPVPTDTAFSEPGEPAAPRGVRPDLQASAFAMQAAEARATQARRSRLPTLRGFARLETHSAGAFKDPRRDWTAGFVVSVPLFTGFQASAEGRAASSMAEAARTDHRLRLVEADNEVAEARRGLEAARQGADAAAAASEAAEEAVRLMRLRFDEGLVTTADLLAAEASAAELRAGAVDARLRVRLASARLGFLTETTTQDSDR